MYSSSPPCNEIHMVLLIFAVEEAAYSQNRRQGVRRVLHHEIEEKNGLLLLSSFPANPLAMEHMSHSSSSSISQVGCILHRKDDEYTVYSIVRRR